MVIDVKPTVYDKCVVWDIHLKCHMSAGCSSWDLKKRFAAVVVMIVEWYYVAVVLCILQVQMVPIRRSFILLIAVTDLCCTSNHFGGAAHCALLPDVGESGTHGDTDVGRFSQEFCWQSIQPSGLMLCSDVK